MSYYDKEFKPWDIIYGKCVVADEAEQAAVKKFHRDSNRCKCCRTGCDGGDSKDCELYGLPRPIVKVTTDIFENVEGPVVDRSAFKLLEWDWDQVDGDGLVSKDYPLTCFFQITDSTPHVDYLIVTRHPELVREKWPVDIIGDENSGPSPEYCRNRPNVILATYVETQSDIERLVPDLIKCRDLCKGLAVVCNPKEELDFNFKPLLEKPEGYTNFAIEYLNLIIADGNEHPIHPDWLRSLRDQCRAARVPFNFAGWGSYIPSSCIPPCPDTGHYLWPWKNQADETMMLSIDAELSGRLLDGIEHNGVLEVRHGGG